MRVGPGCGLGHQLRTGGLTSPKSLEYYALHSQLHYRINGREVKKPGESRKRQAPGSEPVIPAGLLESARRSLLTDKIEAPKQGQKCVVCGADCAPNASEQLCWVCRRLKISAWREAEQQMPAQE